MPHRTVLLTIAIVLACASPAHGYTLGNTGLAWRCTPIRVRVEMTDWQGDVARMAVREMQDATPRLDFVLTDVRADVVVRFGDPGPGNGAVTVLAATDTTYVSGEVIVSPNTPRRWVKATILHELGHVAGLDHVTHGERSVMGMTDVPWRKFQPDDRDALAVVACR